MQYRFVCRHRHPGRDERTGEELVQVEEETVPG
jgi:hypothetical protein